MNPTEPCVECGSTAVRTLAINAYCEQCAEAILAPIRARVIQTPGQGIGRQIAPRPDWGTKWADLECDECSAGWTGPINEPCSYCAVRHEQTRQHQRDLCLAAPDDQTTPTAWAHRLQHAIEAGLITRTEANHAIRRSTERRSA